MAQKIGFVAVGLMGHGMAKNLLKKGYEVALMAHKNRKPIDDLVAQGAKEGKTPKDVTAQSDVVILCVTGAPQVEQVVYGKAGILEAGRPGLALLDCSTSERAMCERVAKDPAAKKADYAAA